MAYIVDYALTENGAGGATSVTANVPPHQTDDYLVVFSSVNGTAGGTSGNTNSGITVSGWTQIGTFQIANAGIASSVYYLKCASSSETCTVAITTADDYAIKIICIRDADTTNFLDSGTVVSSNNVSTASQWSSPTMVTSQNDSLVMYCHAYDGSIPALHTDPGTMFFISSDSTGTSANTSAGAGVAWYMQRTAGTTPGPSWTCNIGDDRTNHVFAIRNKSGGRIPAYIDDANTTAATVMMGHHVTALNNLTFAAALTIANIGPGGSGKAATLDAGALVADYGLNPYSGAVSSTPVATAATSVAGFEITLTNTINMSSGFLVGTIIALNPKMANYNHGNITQGGSYVVLASGTTADTLYRSYQIAARDSDPNTGRRMVFSVQPSQSVTAYGTNGTFDVTAVKRLLFLSNCPTATITLYTAEWFHVTKIACAGGDSTNPVDTEGLAAIGSSFRIPLFERSGAAGLLCLVPIQIGGGDAINFQIAAGALQFPRFYSTTKKQINFHADGATAIGISYAGKSGDVIKHTNSVVTSASPYYWEINSAATSAATWDFTGLTVVGASVTLRNVMTFTSMTFSGCSAITASSCALSNCAISNVPATNDSITTNSTTTFASCSFDTTAVTSGNGMLSIATADLDMFTDCTFTGSGSSGHAIRLTSTGTVSFSGNTFTSYGADGSNSAAIYNDSGGAVTITITGNGSTPTVRNGSGASTVIIADSVTTLINIKDPDGNNEQYVNVYLEAADASGDLPYQQSITSITRSGTTATVTFVAAHGLQSNEYLKLYGITDTNNQSDLSGAFQVTVTGATTLTYTTATTGPSPYNGTITGTGATIYGVTDASGNISSSRTYGSNQPLTGFARKSDDGVTYFKTIELIDTVNSSTGLTINRRLVSDGLVNP